MVIENAKKKALQICMDIAIEYNEGEVKKFALPSVQKAWKLGREALDFKIKEDRLRNRDFTL
ncbi:MAG: hypothetical protein ACJAS1_002491 [Oleiphilaceae bacterium]